jgi:hypothetical protein
MASLILPSFRLTQAAAIQGNDKFRLESSASSQSFRAGCRSPIAATVKHRLLWASAFFGFSRMASLKSCAANG